MGTKLKVDFENENTLKLLIRLSIPAIISMLVNSLNNVSDGIFLGRFIGGNALAATGIVLPMQLFYMAIATMIAIGGVSIISRAIGKNDFKTAEKVVGNIYMLIFIFSISIVVIGFLFSDEIVRMIGGNNILFNNSKEYFLGTLIGWLFYPIAIATNNILRAVGDIKKSSILIVMNVFINIFLNYIFLTQTNLGVFGVGLATSIAYFSSFLLSIFYYKRGYLIIKLKKINLTIKSGFSREILKLGIPVFVRQMVNSVTILIFDWFIIIFAPPAFLGSFAILFKLSNLMIIPVFGLIQGLTPVAGYNFGGRNFKRLKKVVKEGLIIGFLLTLAVALVVVIFNDSVLKLFTLDPDILAHAKIYILPMFIFLPFFTISLVGTTVFQSFGKIKISLLLAIVRNLFLNIPIFVLITLILSYKYSLLSFPISDLISGLMSIYIIIYGFKKIKKNWEVTIG